MPNHLGGRGVPKYIKQNMEQFGSDGQQYDESYNFAEQQSNTDYGHGGQAQQTSTNAATAAAPTTNNHHTSNGSRQNKGKHGKQQSSGASGGNATAAKQQPAGIVINMDDMPPLSGTTISPSAAADPAKSGRISYSSIVAAVGTQAPK